VTRLTQMKKSEVFSKWLEGEMALLKKSNKLVIAKEYEPTPTAMPPSAPAVKPPAQPPAAKAH
jgi:hypothetical protein